MALTLADAQAQEKLKIGIVATLSGPPAVLGQQLRNGFNLAVKRLDGKLGGREVEVVVADDELKPDLAVTKVKALVERDRVSFVVGPIFSNILAAIMKPSTEGGAILVSPNAGTLMRGSGVDHSWSWVTATTMNARIPSASAATPATCRASQVASACR